MPPVTVKFAARAAVPSGVFDSTVTGASPLMVARSVADCAPTWRGRSAQNTPASKATVDRQAAERAAAKGRISFMEKWYIHRLKFATAKCHVQFVFRQRGLGGAAGAVGWR